MSENLECKQCAPIDYPIATCPDINYLETLCDPSFIQPIKCSYWGGAPITCLGISTNDTGEQVIQKLATAICLVTDPIAYSNYVKVSPQDTTSGYLEQKIVAGTNVTITKQNVGGNERLCVNASFTESLLTFTSTDNTILITPLLLNRNLGVKLSTDAGNGITKTATGLFAPLDSYKVKTTIDDTTPEFLLAKLVAGSNITLTKTVTSGIEKITIAATASGGISTVHTLPSLSILLSGNGSLSTPITASIKLSSNIYNAASFDTSDGSLLVLPSDKFVKVSLQDTNASYLENKIVAGTGITRTKLNGGGNESLEFSLDTSFNGLIRNQNTAQSSSTFYITGLGRVGSLRSDGDTFLSPSVTTGTYSLLLNNTATGRVEKISPTDFITSYSASYTLPIATLTTLGGVKIGNGISVTSDGTISSSGSYSLPTATDLILGGVKVGTTLVISSGVLDLPQALATASSPTFTNITATGTITATGGGFDSDMRLKKLIKYNPIIKDIELIKTVAYFKDDKFHIGYFAQEVNEILPSSIIEKENGFLAVAYHEVHTAKINYLENKIKDLENLINSIK